MKLYVHSLSRYEPHLIFRDRIELPSIWQLLLILIFRIRTKLSGRKSDNDKPIMTVCVENFVINTQEREIFEQLVHQSLKQSQDAKKSLDRSEHSSKQTVQSLANDSLSLSMQYFLPHVLGLRAFLV
ncbi:hypothetical protein EON65_42525, partial [archaeon]